MTFVLIPGAGGVAWYWHRVAPLLEEKGHRAVAVELPGDDPKVGLEGYASLVVKAAARARDVVLVAQSLGGFTAALVCERRKVAQLVFVNAMIPRPGERVADWGPATGSSQARKAAARRGGWSERFDEATYFLHDVPEAVREEGAKHERLEAEGVFTEVCRFTKWPDVPTHVIAGRDDRLFPHSFQKRVARERLGLKRIDVIRGGHLVALSNPKGLAAKLLSYAVRAAPSSRGRRS